MENRLPKALQLKVAALNRAIFLKDAERAARLFEEIQAVEPGFVLRDPIQFQLAELLEQGECPREAMKAFELGLEAYARQKSRPAADLSMGRLAARLDQPDKAFFHLERYLSGGGTEEGMREARALLANLRKPAPSWQQAVDPSTEQLRISDVNDPPIPKGTGSPEHPFVITDDTNDDMIAISRLDGVTSSPLEAKSAVELPGEFSPPQTPPPPRLPPPMARPAPPSIQPRQVEPPEPLPLTPDTAFPLRQVKPLHAPKPLVPQPRELPPDLVAPSPETPSRPPSREVQRMDSETLEIAPPTQPLESAPPPQAVPAGRPSAAPHLDGEFALILRLGVKIRIESVAEMMAADLGTSLDDARKLIMKQKGILYDRMDYSETMALKPKVLASGQELMLVKVPRGLRPGQRQTVNQVEIKQQGLRLVTAEGLRRVRWEELRLVNSGFLGNIPVVTLVAFDPTEEFELAGNIFHFSPWANPSTGDRHGVAGFLAVLKEHAPRTIFTTVSEKLLEKPSRTPQIFPTREEYTSYTLYFLLHHLGEPLSLAELAPMAQDSTDW